MTERVSEGGERSPVLGFRLLMRRGVWCAVVVGTVAVGFGWAWPVLPVVDGAFTQLLNNAAFAIITLPLHGVIACIMLIKLDGCAMPD